MTAVLFGSRSCGACRLLDPIVEDVAHETGVTLTHVDVEHEQALIARYAVRALPTLVFLAHDRVVGQVLGAVPRKALKAQFLNAMQKSS